MTSEAGKWAVSDLPIGWKWEGFGSVFTNVTSSKQKLKTTGYQTDGRFPVIDQGQDFIGGWTDDESLVLDVAPPLVIFGDHTRCVKFVDEPFVQGADGVKVFATAPHVLPRFGYWLLKSIQLPDKGYSRHFKFLKASEFPIPPVEVQSEIVERLDAVTVSLQTVGSCLTPIPNLIEKFRQSVLAAAFRGDLTNEWREQNPDVEPASVLLERIRAERRECWIEDAAEKGRARAEAKARKAGKLWTDEDNEQVLAKERAKAAKKYEEPEPVDPTGLPELPETWCWARLEELTSPSETVCYGVVQPGPECDDGTPLIRVCDIRDGIVFRDDLRSISKTVDDQYARSRIRGGEVLVTVVGTIGRTAVAPAWASGSNIARAVARAVPIHSDMAWWLSSALAAPRLQRWLVRGSREVARKTLNIGTLTEAVLPVAPPSEMARVESNVSEALQRARAARRQTADTTSLLSKLERSVLSQAFTGPEHGD